MMKKPGYADQDFWVRLAFMLVFWAVLNITLSVFGVALLLLTILRFGSQYESELLNKAVFSITCFIQQIFAFLSFQTEEKPFPFQAWPETEVNDGANE